MILLNGDAHSDRIRLGIGPQEGFAQNCQLAWELPIGGRGNGVGQLM